MVGWFCGYLLWSSRVILKANVGFRYNKAFGQVFTEFRSEIGQFCKTPHLAETPEFHQNSGRMHNQRSHILLFVIARLCTVMTWKTSSSLKRPCFRWKGGNHPCTWALQIMQPCWLHEQKMSWTPPLFGQISHNHNNYTPMAEATPDPPSLPAERSQIKRHYHLTLLFKGIIRLLYSAIPLASSININKTLHRIVPSLAVTHN